MATYTQGNISEATGFDAGDLFDSEAQVRDYFTVTSLRECTSQTWGRDDDYRELDTDENLQAWLDAMADAVIANKWHCAF